MNSFIFWGDWFWVNGMCFDLLDLMWWFFCFVWRGAARDGTFLETSVSVRRRFFVLMLLSLWMLDLFLMYLGSDVVLFLLCVCFLVCMLVLWIRIVVFSLFELLCNLLVLFWVCLWVLVWCFDMFLGMLWECLWMFWVWCVLLCCCCWLVWVLWCWMWC